MKKGKLIALVGSFCLIVAMIACAAPAPAPTPAPTPAPAPAPAPTPTPAPEVIEWRLQHMYPTGSRDDQLTQLFCDHVLKASGGRLKITKYGMGTLVPATEMLDAVRTGALEMGYTIGPYHAGTIPAANLGFTLPFITRELFETYVINHEVGVEDILREAYAEHNVYLISLVPLSYVNLWSKVPIRSLADFKGLKIRASGITADVLASAGAAPTWFPGPEIYGALERGVIDAAQWGDEGTNMDLGFHEITKYVIQPLQITVGDFYVNMDAWEALPDDLKEIVTLAVYVEGIEFAEVADYSIVDARRQLVDKYGFEIITLPEAEIAKLRNLAIIALDKYAAKDPTSTKLVAAVKDYLAARE